VNTFILGRGKLFFLEPLARERIAEFLVRWLRNGAEVFRAGEATTFLRKRRIETPTIHGEIAFDDDAQLAISSLSLIVRQKVSATLERFYRFFAIERDGQQELWYDLFTRDETERDIERDKGNHVPFHLLPLPFVSLFAEEPGICDYYEEKPLPLQDASLPLFSSEDIVHPDQREQIERSTRLLVKIIQDSSRRLPLIFLNESAYVPYFFGIAHCVVLSRVFALEFGERYSRNITAYNNAVRLFPASWRIDDSPQATRLVLPSVLRNTVWKNAIRIHYDLLRYVTQSPFHDEPSSGIRPRLSGSSPLASDDRSAVSHHPSDVLLADLVARVQRIEEHLFNHDR